MTTPRQFYTTFIGFQCGNESFQDCQFLVWKCWCCCSYKFTWTPQLYGKCPRSSAATIFIMWIFSSCMPRVQMSAGQQSFLLCFHHVALALCTISNCRPIRRYSQKLVTGGVHSLCFILLFMFWTVYCIIVFYITCFYCTICLYCSLYVVYVLPIQLLGCHSCNKRLSLLSLYLFWKMENIGKNTCKWAPNVEIFLCYRKPWLPISREVSGIDS